MVGCRKGEEVATFDFGSTVVLIFETPAGFTWNVDEGKHVSLGETIGAVGRTGGLDEALDWEASRRGRWGMEGRAWVAGAEVEGHWPPAPGSVPVWAGLAVSGTWESLAWAPKSGLAVPVRLGQE